MGAATGQLGLGHTAEEVQAMFMAAVLASTPPGSVAIGQPAGGGTSEGDPDPNPEVLYPHPNLDPT